MVENLKCWTNRLMLWDITVWHFPSGGNPHDYLWPSDIFQLAETHNWTTYDRVTFSIKWKLTSGFFYDRLTFSIKQKLKDGFFVTVWHFPSGANPPYDYLWPSDIFQLVETHHWTTCDRLTFSNTIHECWTVSYLKCRSWKMSDLHFLGFGRCATTSHIFHTWISNIFQHKSSKLRFRTTSSIN